MSINIITGQLLFDMFKQGTNELNKNKSIVDSLNVFPVPDGDTGTNMSLTMNAALNEAKKVSDGNVEIVAKAIAKGSLLGARGNSGVILSQIFRGFAKGCEEKEELEIDDFIEALNLAAKTAYKAVLKPVEGTILTVVRKTAEKAEELKEADLKINEAMNIILERSKEILNQTPEYLDVLKQAGVVDAGGKGLVFIFEGFEHVLSGKTADDIIEFEEKEVFHAQKSINTEDIKFAYCTEFIIRTKNDDNDLRKSIEKLGDSMVYVKDDDIIKVHVHTNNPGIALEHALKVGELINIKIENMKEQHSSILEDSYDDELKKYGFIAVAMGDGISKIFKDFGVDYIIEGGQTMNPSTDDIVKAIEKINAENIFILPNNSNIILAANQAKSLSDKNISVIPSKSIPQGISAMIGFDGSKNFEDNMSVMEENLKTVKTVQVTFSVRDTVFDGVEIKENDILGIRDGMISSNGTDMEKVIMETIDTTVDEETEIITLYYGSDISEDSANEIAEKLEEKYDEIDIEVYYGGQPLYYYIFSVE